MTDLETKLRAVWLAWANQQRSAMELTPIGELPANSPDVEGLMELAREAAAIGAAHERELCVLEATVDWHTSHWPWPDHDPRSVCTRAAGAAQRQADLIEWLQTRFNANQIEELVIDRAIGEIESGAWKAP